MSKIHINHQPNQKHLEIPVANDNGTIVAGVYRMMINGNTAFDLLIDSEEHDGITQRIKDQTYTLPQEFDLPFQLLKPGDRLLDLGSHIGTFSLYAASMGYQIVAVDGSPRNIALLQASADANGFNNVRTIWSAISDEQGTLDFIVAGPYGLLANDMLEDPTVSVPAITVDELLAEMDWDNVDFIKMDIEGAEVKALAGMSQLLSREDAPNVMFECNGHTLHYFEETPNTLLKAFENYGFTLYLIEDGLLVPCTSSDLQVGVCVDYLATKQTLPLLDGWKVAKPLSHQHILDQLRVSTYGIDQHAREYLCRAIGQAEGALRTDPTVVTTPGILRLDNPVYDEVSRMYATIVQQDALIKDLQNTITDLRNTLAGYENGRFIRTTRWLHAKIQKLKSKVQ